MSQTTTSGPRRGSHGHLAAAGLTLLAACLAAGTSRARTITVDTLADNDADDGRCSLREAVRSANHNRAPNDDCPDGTGADTIVLPKGRILLNTALPAINETTTLLGPGEKSATIDAGGAFRLFNFDAPAGRVLIIRDVALERGDAGSAEGGAIRVGAGDLILTDVRIENCSAASGGGIYADGSSLIWIVRSTLRGNDAGIGGGVYALNTKLDIENSTFVANQATEPQAGNGGAVFATADSTVEVDNSTFSGNVAANDGGAMALDSSTATITSATIVLNVADSNSAGGGEGGGIALNASVLELENSIVAMNQDRSFMKIHPDISRPGQSGSTLISKLSNFIGDHTSVENVFPESANHNRPNENGDYVGSWANRLDPQLAALADNGGPTWTHLPRPGSRVIDAGYLPKTFADERGFHNRTTRLRAVDDPTAPNMTENVSDSGAVEVGAEAALPAP